MRSFSEDIKIADYKLDTSDMIVGNNIEEYSKKSMMMSVINFVNINKMVYTGYGEESFSSIGQERVNNILKPNNNIIVTGAELRFSTATSNHQEYLSKTYRAKEKAKLDNTNLLGKATREAVDKIVKETLDSYKIAIDDEGLKMLQDKVWYFHSRKIVAVPYTIENILQYKCYERHIGRYKWFTNEEGKFEGTFRVDMTQGEYSNEIPMRQIYSTIASVNQIRTASSISSIDGVEITSYGCIKPIIFEEKDRAILVDNLFIYELKGEELNIVGYRCGKEMVLMDGVNPKDLKKLANNWKIITEYANMILPLGVQE